MAYLDPELSQEMDQLRDAQNMQNITQPGLGGTTNAQVEAAKEAASDVPLINLDFNEPSMLRSALRLGTVQNSYKVYERTVLPNDPNFSLERYKDELHSKVSPDDWYRFQGVQSKAEFDNLLADINEETQDRAYLANATGGNGTIATLLAAAADPVNYIPFVDFVSGGRLAYGASKIGLGARATGTVYGVSAGASAALLSGAANELTSPTGDASRIPDNMYAGMILGGMFGAAGAFSPEIARSAEKFANGFRLLPDPRAAVTQGKVFLREFVEDETGSLNFGALVPEKKVPAKNDDPLADMDGSHRKAYDEAAAYNAENIETPPGKPTPITDFLYQAANKVPYLKTTADSFFNSGSEIFKMLGHRLWESPSGAFRNNRSAAMMGAQYEGWIAAPVTQMQEAYFKKWLQETGTQNSRGARYAFMRESEMGMQSWWHDGVRTETSQAIREFNDLRNEAAKRDRTALRGKEGENPVNGSDILEDKDGWSTHQWNYGAMERAMAMMAPELSPAARQKNLIDSMVSGYKKLYPSMDAEDLGIWAKAVYRRAKAMSNGITTSAIKMLQSEGQEYMMQMLKDSGVAEAKAQRIIDGLRNITAQDRIIKNLKPRTDIDLRTPIYGTDLMLVDLIKLDHAATWIQHARTSGYAAGLARAGFQQEDLDLLISAGQDELRRKGLPPLDEADVEQLRTAFTGRALNGGVNPWVRRGTMLTNLSLLSANSLMQLAETGMAMGYFGIQNFIKFGGKEIKDFIKGTEPRAMEEMASISTYIDGEEALLMPERQLDDLRISPSDEWKIAQLIDKGLVKGRKIQGVLNGFEIIKQMQQRIVTRLFLQEMGKMSKGMNNLSEARMFDMGLGTKADREMFDRVMENFRKHAEFNEQGEVVALNFHKWNDTDVFDFNLLARRTTSQLVQRMERGEGTSLASETFGHVLTNLKNFTLLALQKQTLRSMRLQDERALAQTVYGMAMAGMVYVGKQGISGKEEKKLSPEDIFKGSFGISSITSPIGMLADPVGSMMGIDSLKFNTYSRPGVAGSTIIPVPPLFTQGEKIAHIPESLISAGMGNADKRDIAALQALPIIGNFPGMGIIWNGIKDDIDEKTKKAKEEEKKLRKAEEERQRKAKNPTKTVISEPQPSDRDRKEVENFIKSAQ